MNSRKEIRMSRLFNRESKRLVLVTIDHGICMNAIKEISDPIEVVREIVEGGADAILLTPEIVKLPTRNY